MMLYKLIVIQEKTSWFYYEPGLIETAHVFEYWKWFAGRAFIISHIHWRRHWSIALLPWMTDT